MSILRAMAMFKDSSIRAPVCCKKRHKAISVLVSQLTPRALPRRTAFRYTSLAAAERFGRMRDTTSGCSTRHGSAFPACSGEGLLLSSGHAGFRRCSPRAIGARLHEAATLGDAPAHGLSVPTGAFPFLAAVAQLGVVSS